jgi:TIR domain
VWLDTWRIELGDSIVGRINSGLSEVSHLVLCCSAASSTSAWMDREWMSALARQLAGAGVRVLPVRLAGGELPAILADIKYADLSERWQEGVHAICKALG